MATLPLPIVAKRRSATASSCEACFLAVSWCFHCLCMFLCVIITYALVIYCVHPWRITLDPTCVKTKDAFEIVPRVPQSYPAPLRSLLWMDQAGTISNSDLGGDSGDLFIGFGDYTGGKFDPVTRSIYLSSHGPSTLWANYHLAYWMLMDNAKIDYGYTFIFGEDFRWAQIVPSVSILGGWIGTVSLPTFFANFSMVMQDTEEIRTGKCPPAKNASRDEFSKCAKWVRSTTIPLAFWREPEYYYVFEIADGERAPVQPYYDLFLERAENETNPDAVEWNKYLGTQMPETCKELHTSMLDQSRETIHGHTPQWF